MPNILNPDEDGEAQPLPASLDLNPLKLFDIAKSEGRPLFTCAPMVRYSKLAFRQTVGEYGVDLAWTPMILAKEFNRSMLARDSDFTLSPAQPTTVIQFGCNSPLELSRATLLVAPYVNGVDINCGCPQSWACAEKLGAALMHERELVADMVRAAKGALENEGYNGKKTVSVKIRIHKDLRDTIDFIKTVEEAGADFITIHPRLRSTMSSVPANMEALKLLTSITTIPTISNADIFSLSGALSHAKEVGVDGVMSARGILQNPGLFSEKGRDGCTWEMVETFINKVTIAPIPFKLIVHHISEMVGSDRSQSGVTLMTKEERLGMMECMNFLDLVDYLDELRAGEGGLRRDFGR